MFTDLLDSTALLSRVGETAAEDLRRERFAIPGPAADGRGGREVKNLGDGVMVVFRSTGDAVATAERGLRNGRGSTALTEADAMRAKRTA